ncbi:MAG: response regulator [Sphingomonadaceae bacterium]|nr:response regulator [Sphingomonadaceae bacterium]
MAYILIVDEDYLSAEIASDALVQAGHSCGSVHDVQSARSLLSHKQPDLLLLSASLPAGSSAALMRELRLSDEYHQLPIILLGLQSAMLPSAQEVLPKPTMPAVLVGRVDAILQATGSRAHYWHSTHGSAKRA